MKLFILAKVKKNKKDKPGGSVLLKDARYLEDWIWEAVRRIASKQEQQGE